MSDFNHNRSRYGAAGSGLGSDGAFKKFGKSAQAGAVGERYLDAAITRTDTVRDYPIWRSLRVPNARGYGNVDVDFALASGNKVILVDCKMWSAGKVYWTAFGRVMQGLSVKEPKISRNMAMALAKYREALPGVSVSAIVVFVPNRQGNLPTSVFGLRWPGGIRSHFTSDGLRRVKSFLGTPAPVEPKIQAVLGRLVKG